MSLEGNLIPKIPEELAYNLPPAIDEGLQSIQLRQIQYGSIQSGDTCPRGTEIQIIIPQLPGCFLDTTTTFINVEGHFLFQKSNVALNAKCYNGEWAALIGSGWSLFNRYVVYANNQQVTDDILEPGVLMSALYNLTMSEDGQKASFPMGLNSFWGNNANDQRCASIEQGLIKFRLGTTNNPIVSDGGNPIGTADAAAQLVKVMFNFQIPLIGTLGIGSDKMYPLFFGVNKISLYTDDASQYLMVQSGNTYPQISGSGIKFEKVEFVGNYLKANMQTFNNIITSLPNEQFVTRVTSFVQSAFNIPSQISGLYQYQITSRRSCVKWVLPIFSPSNAACKKFTSVCPFLTQGTYLGVNGDMYPQLPLDPFNRPTDTQTYMETTLMIAHAATGKHNIPPQCYFTHAREMQVFDDAGLFWAPSAAAGGGLTWASGEGHNPPAMKPIYFTYRPYAPNTADGINYQLKRGASSPMFYLPFDVEHFSKRSFVSGISTLSGSTILNLQMLYGTEQDVGINVMVFCAFDALLKFDYRSKACVFVV